MGSQGNSTASLGDSPDVLHNSSSRLTGSEQQQSQGNVGEHHLRSESPDRDGESDNEGDDRRKPMPGRGGGGSSTGNQGLAFRAPVPASKPAAQQQPKTSSSARSVQARHASPAVSGTPPPKSSRYFILKSVNHENIARAVAEGIWATQRHNEEKLNHAFKTSPAVYLIFSVNMSGHFQGYARMTTALGGAKSRPGGWLGNTSVGSIFGIEWRRVLDLPFSATEHLFNPMNENKPVRIARDGQELPAELGQQMLSLFEAAAKERGVAQPAPPPRPAGGAMGGRPPAPPRPPPFRPPPLGGSMGGGGLSSGMGMPMGGGPDAMVFNEMGMPVGNLRNFGMGGGGMMGGGMDGGMMRGGMGNMMGGMRPGGLRPQGMNGMQMGMMGPDMMMGGGGMGGPINSMGMPSAMRGSGGGNTMGMGAGMGMGMGLSSGMGDGMAMGMTSMAPFMGGDRRRSPERRSRRRTRSRSRSRSRSGSPRRRLRRSRSRSRGRDRDSGRSSSKPNLLQMSYDEYLEHFERVRRERATSRPSSLPTASQDQAAAFGGSMMNSGMGGSMMGNGMGSSIMGNGMGSSMLGGVGSSMGGVGNSMGGGMNGGNGQVLMSEEAYIRHCQQHAAQKGTTLNLVQVRAYYQQMKAMMGQG